MPAILVVYDVKNEKAYWLYTQRYFALGSFAVSDDQAKISLRIPMTNIVDADAVKLFRDFKNEVINRMKGVPLHDE